MAKNFILFYKQIKLSSMEVSKQMLFKGEVYIWLCWLSPRKTTEFRIGKLQNLGSKMMPTLTSIIILMENYERAMQIIDKFERTYQQKVKINRILVHEML